MYTTGTAATANALVDALVLFANTQLGTTKTKDVNETFNNVEYRIVVLKKADRYWGIASGSGGLYLRATTSDAVGPWFGSPGPARPVTDAVVQPFAPPFLSYHFFSEGTVFHAVVEMSSGGYATFSFGDITKFTPFQGGHYATGTNTQPLQTPFTDLGYLTSFGKGYPFYSSNGASGSSACGHVYVPYDGKSYAFFGRATPDAQSSVAFGSGLGSVSGRLLSGGISPNAINNRAAAIPMTIYLRETEAGGSGLLMPLGEVPNFRYINIRDLNPKDIVNTDWMVFPLQAKNYGVANSLQNTGDHGWAIRK